MSNYKRLALGLLLAIAFCLAGCYVGYLIQPNSHIEDGFGIAAFAFASVFGLWFLLWCVKLGLQVGGEVGQAINTLDRPILSPNEIELALWREWGRQPSVQEVAAVEQMLHNERNQALVTAGMGAGALYLLLHKA